MEDSALSWSWYVVSQLEKSGKKLTDQEIGELVGVSPSGIHNWRRSKNFLKPSADHVITFWREFGDGTTLAEALIAAGYGDESDHARR